MREINLFTGCDIACDIAGDIAKTSIFLLLTIASPASYRIEKAYCVVAMVILRIIHS